MFETRTESVVLKKRTKTGTDALNNPVYTWTSQTLDGCLVRRETSEDIGANTYRAEGHNVKYCLYVPNTYDLDFENAIVSVDGEELKVVGAPKKQLHAPTNYAYVVYLVVQHG